MAITPEKNDVDISSLFYFKKPVTIITKDAQPVTFYMRLVGDAELQRARVKALRDSRKLRDALKDKNSDEYLAYMPDVEDLSKERLVEVILLGRLKEISSDVVDEVEIPFPKEPEEDATLEEQEQYQLEIDKYPEKREQIVREEIIKRSTEVKKELLEMNVKQLQKDYIVSLRNELCEATLTTSFYEHIIFYSLYKNSDYKEHLFDNFEDYSNLPSEIKMELLEEYKNLELGMDELKK